MVQEIYIIDDDSNLTKDLKELFKREKEYVFKNVKTKEIEVALKNIPNLIILNENNIERDIIQLCEEIRKDEDNSITPIIVISSNREKEHKLEVLKKAVEYYIHNPVDMDYLYNTIKNIIRLLYTNRRVSPLTGLPGNVQINAELKKRFLNKEEFAAVYLDLDNFKAYNDIYGFLKGDEIIKFTARTIVKNVHESENSFVGHIGGDDFVAIVPMSENVEAICQNIVADFDNQVGSYFTKEDLEKGYLEVPNRKGIMEEFPITSISVGVVMVDEGRFKNILEIGEAAAGVKHLAKSIFGSTYVIDRRKI